MPASPAAGQHAHTSRMEPRSRRRSVRRPTEGLAIQRNDLLSDPAAQAFVADAAPSGMTEALARRLAESSKPLLTVDSPANANLVGMGARPVQSHRVKRLLGLVDTTDWGSRHAANV